MNKGDFHLFDITRLLQGDVPASFYIELIIRGIVVYLIIVASLRLMGKRMATQLTRNELAAIATLAAAGGTVIQTPDKGLLPAMLIAGIVILMQRLVAGRAMKSGKFEVLTQGHMNTLVNDCCLQIKEMDATRISRERVFAQLRSDNIKHLGEVKRFYMEITGSFSLVKNQHPQPGLSIIPDWDMEFNAELQKDNSKQVCGHCGAAKEPQLSYCTHCSHTNWVAPVSETPPPAPKHNTVGYATADTAGQRLG